MHNLGLFGDFIGGIVGTIITFISVILLFVAWCTSYKTFRLARETDTRNKMMSIISEMLDTHDGIRATQSMDTSAILSEINKVYQITHNLTKHNPEISRDNNIDISYTFVFYGLSTNSADALKSYGHELIRDIHNELRAEQIRTTERLPRFCKGHQDLLSHYMRNLFAMYSFIDESEL